MFLETWVTSRYELQISQLRIIEQKTKKKKSETWVGQDSRRARAEV